MIFSALVVACAWYGLRRQGRRDKSRVDESPAELSHQRPHDVRVDADEQVTGRPLAIPATSTTRSAQDEQPHLAEVVPVVGRTRRQHLTHLGTGVIPLATDQERKLNRRIIAAGMSMTTAIVGIIYPPILVVTLGTALYSTIPIIREAYKSIVHDHKLRMSVLGSAFLVGEYAGGFFIVGGFGLFVYSLCEKLVLMTQDRSQQRLISIFGQQSRLVWVSVNGVEMEVPIESVQAGDTVVLQAGQVVPVDGVVTWGNASIDQHTLTGESRPAEKSAGDRVLTATLMLGGKIFVRVENTGRGTVAEQIGVLLNNTASYQASIVAAGERLADKSVAPTLLLALVAWPVSGYVYMVTVLGSSVGLNVRFTAPIGMLNFLNLSAANGILIRDGRALELLNGVDTLVFDKTGTLTMDQQEIAEIHTCAELDSDAVLMYAAAAEDRQTHPIARAIQAEAKKRGLALPGIDHARYEVGYGLTVHLDDHVVRVGSERFMALEDIEQTARMRALGQLGDEKGHSLVMVAVDDRLVGAIELEPALRPEVKAVVRAMRKRNLDILIISGDQERPTYEIAQALGIPNYFANTLPQDKARVIDQLQSEGRSVCFVGDGINDSVALKKANVSISLSGASTAATDTAQIVLMSGGLNHLPMVFDLARDYNLNMRAGSALAVGQGAIVVGGALLGVVGIIFGRVIWLAGLAAGLVIAESPLLRPRGIAGR